MSRSELIAPVSDEKPVALRARGRLADVAALAGPYLGLLLVVVLFGYLTWDPANPQRWILNAVNLRIVAVHTAITAAVALGMTVIMISGGIDLSVGYVVSLITVVTMLVFRWAAGRAELAGTASVWAVGAGLCTGVLAGWSNGMLITRLKVVPFVVTLGMMGVARGLAQSLSKGSPVTFPDPANAPTWVSWLAALQPTPAWLLVGPAVWSVVFFAVVVAVILRYTVLGRYCFALGSNEATARLCGVNVARTKVILYTLAGLLTGWGGIIQFARSSAGLHDVAAGLELDVIAAVVIGGGSLSGGEGTVTGTLVGAVLIQLLENGCFKLALPMEFRYIIIGLIIIVVSAINAWRQRRLR